ncbi:lysis system i-spanin subunit Rz, partial [Kalamiella sp. sgz302252]|uniref:lysis system i-spanin subunit Rz n=1 Tax=Pantoea sp. sgz302252 TaxID=3341827 RepID=UPI0036D26064
MIARIVVLALLLLTVAGLGRATLYYREQCAAANSLAAERLREVNEMQRRQQAVAALDAKLTGELADAQNNIHRLQHDVAAGRHRLQLAATCRHDSARATRMA